MEKVIPPGLNYAEIKPEAIENQIRMVKFLPVSNVQNQRPNDVIRFHLQGNGFYDPYSAYLRIQVSFDDADIPKPKSGINGMFLDRSAHSLINRLVIRSQGTELERIEQYDVMAAMVNDMVYSHEQRVLHHYEGFACRQKVEPNIYPGLDNEASKLLSAVNMYNADGPEQINTHFGDRGFYKLGIEASKATKDSFKGLDASTRVIGLGSNGAPITVKDLFGYEDSTGEFTLPAANAALGISKEEIKVEDEDKVYYYISGPQTLEFCIPIYSGIIGVMMPDKKLLPLSLLPLEVEFTLNPHAFYAVGEVTSRRYVVTTCELWTHTLFFEQELHRSLEAVVAEAGIFLHYESFYLTPINTYNYIIPKFHQLGIFLKSVEAIHWVFLYQNYLSDPGVRKLHFVSHNIRNLQLRNGMDLIPSEPIMTYNGGTQFGQSAISGNHHQLLIETYKGWNKMHDPLSDGAINPFNYQIDTVLSKCTSIQQLMAQQTLVGRCQYALSLVGEEIGQNKSIVGGKKTVLPFDLNFDGQKTENTVSVMLAWLRADFIVYVRPDLVVTRLGI